MPTCKIALQTLTDVLGLSDCEFNITGAKILADGIVEFEVEDLSHTLKNDNSVVNLHFSQNAVIRTLTTQQPAPVNAPSLQPIMLWYRYNGESKEWEYNHYSDGHVLNLTRPEAANPDYAKMWKNGKWGYALAYMQPGIIPKVVDKGEFIPCQ